jgi:hypothetical protein
MNRLPRIDLSGRQSGLLLVIRGAHVDRQGQQRWLTKCVCGGSSMPRSQDLEGSHSTSCGCRRTRNPERKQALLDAAIERINAKGRSDQPPTREVAE